MSSDLMLLKNALPDAVIRPALEIQVWLELEIEFIQRKGLLPLRSKPPNQFFQDSTGWTDRSYGWPANFSKCLLAIPLRNILDSLAC